MIKKIYGKHTFCFSILSIFFSILSLLIFSNFQFINELIVSFICLFLILSVGISHGAMDNYKANKLLKIYKLKSKVIFFILYILISVFIIILWSLYSAYTLLLFLLVASYHFGREDTAFLNNSSSNLDQFFYLIKGSLIIFSPLFFHFDQTLKIFETLFLDQQIISFLKIEHWIINAFLSLSVFGYFYFIYKNKFQDYEVFLLDMFCILLLNYVFNPMVAFTMYFCFLHSIRHIISISFELEPNNFIYGVKSFIKKALPLTLVTTILYLIAAIFLSYFYEINDVIIKIIFIGLASLTFPHILLEYLIERNEKRH